ncbi:transcriptional regulator, luxR family [Frankia torreyi]|uniref:Transcriptional regulator, luxR family n=2 Tax=Frankia TaxID=1854 RepID=A0A0D8B6I3_9ACTN|nr:MULTISPECIES: LuxR family transcriptional regulator [Frankia]KJE19776.1 transcriptional regulator, luxR family [Frankia torreyi]
MTGSRSGAGRRPRAVRPKERRRLLAALEALAAGQGRIVEIRGDPGIGKTRLLGELTRQAARRGLPVVSGRCAETDQAVRFGVFSRLLSIQPPPSAEADRSSPGPLLAAMLSTPDAEPSTPGTGSSRPDAEGALFDAARLLLGRAAGDGLVLIVDDVHWADEASNALIDHLVRWPVDAHLLLVLAHRPRQSPPRLLSSLAQGEELGTVDRIDIPPLTLDQAAQLTGLAADDARLRELHQASEGNPHYLLGLTALAHGLSPGWAELTSDAGRGHDVSDLDRPPGDLVSPVLAELAGLDPACLHVVWAAVVLDEAFDVDTAAAVAELAIDPACTAVATLVARDLLVATGDGEAYRLRHPLLARLLYPTVDPGWRRAAHRRAARILGLSGAPPAVLAAHLEHCPQDSGLDEVEVLAWAAEERLASAPPDAVRWLWLALRILAGVDGEDPERVQGLRGELSLGLARALGAAGQLAESLAQIRQTLRLAATLPATARADLASLCAMLAYSLGQHADSQAILTDEIDAAIGEPPGQRAHHPPTAAGRPVRPQARPAVITLLLTRGAVGLLDGTPPSPDDLGLLLRLAREQQDHTAEVGALALRGVVEAFGGNIPAAAATVTRCIAIADRLPDADLADHPEHLALLGWADSVLGRQLDAERHFSRGAALARRTGRDDTLPLLLGGLGAVYHRVGRLADARQTATEVQHLIRNTRRGHHTNLADAIEALAGVWIDGHGSRRAATLAEEAAIERFTARPTPRRSWWGDVAAIWTAYAAETDSGDPHRTMALILDTGGGETLAELSPVLRPMAFEALTAASERLGDVSAALRWADGAEQAAEGLNLGYQRGHALAARAHAVRHAEPAAAGALYQQAADLFAAAGMLSLRTYLLVQGGLCLAAAGRTNPAARQLAVAVELAGRCGAHRLGAQARAALRSLDERRSAGVDALADLTPREREIALVAVGGKTSRQIAYDLRLSPRTVDAHLTRIYRKLGVSSRVTLVRLVDGNGPR